MKTHFRSLAIGLCLSASIFAQGIPQGAPLQQLVNSQTGTSYAIVTADMGKLVTQSNAAASAYTIAACNSTGFANGFQFDLMNVGAGTLTLTPTTSTIDGAATLVLTTGSGAHVACSGGNYFTWHGGAGGSSALTWAQAGSGTLSNGWTNISGREASYAKGSSGIVYLRGAIVQGTTTDGTVLFTLPVGFRPLSVQDIIVPQYTGGTGFKWTWISIQTNGDIQYVKGDGTAANGEVSLSGVAFSTN